MFPLLTISSCGLTSTKTESGKAIVENDHLSVHIYTEPQSQGQSSNKVLNPFLIGHKVKITRKHKSSQLQLKLFS